MLANPVIPSGSTAVVSLCLTACNVADLSDWLRLLRDSTAGAWVGPVVVVADEANTRAVQALGWGAAIASLPRAVRPMAQHVAVGMTKTRLLELPELSQFSTLLYTDSDTWAVRSANEWLASAAVKGDFGLAPGSGESPYATNIMVRNLCLVLHSLSSLSLPNYDLHPPKQARRSASILTRGSFQSGLRRT